MHCTDKLGLQARTIIKWKERVPRKSKNFASRMWSWGAREHYTGKISNRKLSLKKFCPHQSKIKGFNNQRKNQITLIWCVGVPSLPCSVHVCLMLASSWAWSCALLIGPVHVRVGVPHSMWPLTFDLHWYLPVRFNQLMWWRTYLEWHLEDVRLLIVWRWICSTNVVSGLCAGCGGMSLCDFWCCPGCAVLVVLFVDGLWVVSLGECASLRNRMVLLWVCSGPSLLTHLLVQWVYLMHTSDSSCQHWTRLNESGWVFLPHVCLSCCLQGHLCSSTHLVGPASSALWC